MESIQIHCDCCDLDDTADIAADDYDALAAFLGQGAPVSAQEDGQSAPCAPMTVHVGPEECIDGECDEYFDEDGQPTGIEACTHLTTDQACETHSTTDANRVTHAEPWPCQAAGQSF